MNNNIPILVVDGVQRLHRTREGEAVGVHDVSFQIPPGQWTTLLGPNGSGKSTLLKLIATADWAQKGELTINGVRVHAGWSAKDRNAVRALLGVVFQSPALDPLLTVEENLRAAAALLGMAGPDAKARVADLMSQLNINDRARDRVGTLSGGLKRRADLARALLGSPRLLILDEPTVGLDPDARLSLLDTLHGLRELDPAPAILHSTHLTEEAERSDRVLFIDRGRLAADASPGELRSKLGDRTLLIEGDPEEATRWLAGLDLKPGHTEAGRVFVSIDENELERVLPELNRTGRSFSVGPPSLADAYTAIVGRGLESAPRGDET